MAGAIFIAVSSASLSSTLTSSPAQGAGRYSCMLSARAVEVSEIGYRLRGDRCEGLFVVEVSGESQMRLIGFHLGEPTFDLKSPLPVPIRVRSKASGASLRMSSLEPHVRYQMDTDDLVAGKPYQWTTEIVRDSRVALSASAIAAIACTNGCRADDDTRYFPVTIGPEAGPAAAVTLVVRPTVSLNQLKLTVTRNHKVAFTGVVGARVSANEALPLSVDVLARGINDVTLEGFDRRNQAIAIWYGRLEMP
jgi:hypothetical protein